MTPSEPVRRIAGIDAYRGFVMVLMMAEVLHWDRLAKQFPDSQLFGLLARHQSHVAWSGCTLHDLIQPSFSLLVGVALPFSIASRLAAGQTQGMMTLHAAWRAFALVFLGIFLRSMGRPQTNFTFEDTLTQIGLGYLPLFLLGLAGRRACWFAFVAILVGYWLAFALYPLPGEHFDYAAAGALKDWQHNYVGFAAHWNKNTNLAWKFDTWFLNLFPRQQPFAFNGGGYATLSFIPTLGTMVLGAIAGFWMRDIPSIQARLGRLVLVGGACVASGLALDHFGWCPIVKRIWTPSWTLYSGGWCLWLLAFFHASNDATGYSGWSLPLRVVGANSIAAYCFAHSIDDFILSSLRTHFGKDAFKCFGPQYESLVAGVCVLTVLWLILYWMYRRRVFIRL